MINIWLRSRLPRPGDDAGIGLILVVGMMSVLAMLSLVAVSIAQNALSSSTGHLHFENALGVAENGIDQVLAQVQNNKSYVPFTGIAVGATDVSTPAKERAWARSQIATLATTTSNRTTTKQGQYIAFRPSDRQIIYSMSWVPSYTAVMKKAKNSKSRLIKAEYIFAPYAPDKAILTQGDLNFSGSVLVDKVDPATAASVHTNGNVSSSNGSLQVTGTLTSSGSYSVNGNATVATGSGGTQPLVDVPVIDPRSVYQDPGLYASYGGTVGASGYTGQWYDLCSGGTVRARDNSSTTPCTGTALNLAADGVTKLYPFRGWNFTPASAGNAPVWSMDEQSSPYDGVYYAYRTDVVINGKIHNGDPPWHATVLAEADTTAGLCNKVGGTITWKLTDIANMIPGTVLLAGHNLVDSANNDAGDGLFAAADQVYMNTSSATLTGYVVASDQCPNPSNPSTIQGIILRYDRTGESPVTSLVRTTLWLEYVGS
jgi:hypothetical protein